MYILERSITKQYWEPTQTYLLSHMNRNRWSWVGSAGVIRIRCSKNKLAYAVCDYFKEQFTPVGWIWLSRKPKWVAYEVQQTFVLKDYRGNGYAEKLYKAAINTDGLLLASGCSHTKYSTGLWSKFVREKTFNVWAQDFKNLNRISQVTEDDGKVSAFGIEVYHSPFASQDVRLLALRK